MSFIDASENDSFFGQRDHVRRKVSAEGKVDFNTLSPTGKQAALSLTQEGVMQIADENGRPMVSKRKKRPLLHFLSIGLAS